MLGIKDFVARFQLRLLLKNYQPIPMSIPRDLNNRKNILVCLPPGQRELTMIKQFLPEISRIFSSSEIYLLASPGSPVYAIFPRKGYRILTPSLDQVAWSGLARKKYLQFLKQNAFDIILDLNLFPTYFQKSVLLSFPQAIRVGGAVKLGDPYYNLEIKSKFLRDEKNIYKSMLEMIDKLKNSPSATAGNSA
jgi:hypothetical protein